MDGYLAKPFQMAGLKAEIRRVLGAIEASGGNRAVPESGADMPIVDRRVFEQLRELFGEEGHKTLLETFCGDAAVNLGKLGEVIDSHDCAAQHRICHTLKGTSGNLGMVRLQMLCQQLEDQTKAGMEEVSHEQLEVLEALHKASCAAAKGMLALETY